MLLVNNTSLIVAVVLKQTELYWEGKTMNYNMSLAETDQLSDTNCRPNPPVNRSSLRSLSPQPSPSSSWTSVEAWWRSHRFEHPPPPFPQELLFHGTTEKLQPKSLH